MRFQVSVSFCVGHFLSDDANVRTRRGQLARLNIGSPLFRLGNLFRLVQSAPPYTKRKRHRTEVTEGVKG
jgi:hypothetical protein